MMKMMRIMIMMKMLMRIIAIVMFCDYDDDSDQMTMSRCLCAADGSSDDIDQPVRRLFADQELVRSHNLMSLNSVNWSRVMIQLSHFIYAYLQLSGVERCEADAVLPEMEVVVPTGGAGNIAGENQ